MTMLPRLECVFEGNRGGEFGSEGVLEMFDFWWWGEIGGGGAGGTGVFGGLSEVLPFPLANFVFGFADTEFFGNNFFSQFFAVLFRRQPQEYFGLAYG